MKDNKPPTPAFDFKWDADLPKPQQCKCVPTPGQIQSGAIPIHFEPGGIASLAKLVDDEVQAAYDAAQLDKPMKLLRIVDKWIHCHLGCKRTDATNHAVTWIASHLRTGNIVVIKAEQFEKE